MVARERQPRGIGWLTFTGYALKLVRDESVVAKGHLFDGSLYALGLKVIGVEEESVILRCMGCIGDQEIPAQDVALSLVPGRMVSFDLYTPSLQPIVPSLCLFWEPSVQVAQGEIAVLVIAQPLEEDKTNTLR